MSIPNSLTRLVGFAGVTLSVCQSLVIILWLGPLLMGLCH